CPATEVREVRATGHADMLTVVDPFTRRRIAKRRGPTAEFLSGLVQLDAAAVFGQRRGRGQPGQSAADDGDRRVPCSAAHGEFCPLTNRSPPPMPKSRGASRRAASAVLCHGLSRTRRENTSPSHRRIFSNNAR